MTDEITLPPMEFTEDDKKAAIRNAGYLNGNLAAELSCRERQLKASIERVVQLEKALRDCMNNFNMTRLIMPPDAAKQAAEIIAGYRDLLEGK